MAVRRRVYRIEETQLGGPVPAAIGPAANFTIDNPPLIDADAGERHREVMREIKALRIDLDRRLPAAPTRPAAAAAVAQIDPRMAEEARALKSELHTIYEAIKRTKQEIATLHVTGFKGPQMARVTDELDAVVIGTERATQQILKATEEIDESANTLSASVKTDQEHGLAQDIQDRVIQIFEACNFQDLTGQRISKVVASLRFIEAHVMRMIDIWGGLDAFKEFEPEAVKEREGDASLLNGPRLDKDAGHASQNDIDALFA